MNPLFLKTSKEGGMAKDASTASSTKMARPLQNPLGLPSLPSSVWANEESRRPYVSSTSERRTSAASLFHLEEAECAWPSLIWHVWKQLHSQLICQIG